MALLGADVIMLILCRFLVSLAVYIRFRDVCSLSIESGGCEAYILSYGYKKHVQQCQWFV